MTYNVEISTMMTEVVEILRLNDSEINDNRILENINITFQLTSEDYDLMLGSRNIFNEIGLYGILNQFNIVDFTELYFLQKIRLLQQYSNTVDDIRSNLLKLSLEDRISPQDKSIAKKYIDFKISRKYSALDIIISYCSDHINSWNSQKNYIKIVEHNQKLLKCYHGDPEPLGFEFCSFQF